MIIRVVELLRRFTPYELAALALVLATPFVVGTALVVASLITGSIVAVVIISAYYAVIVLAAIVAVLVRLTRWRAFLRERQAPRAQVPIANPDQLFGEISPLVRAHSTEVERRHVLASAAQYSQRTLHMYGTRTRSTWVRDVYARAITRGRLDYTQFESMFRAAVVDPSVDSLLIGRINFEILMALERLLEAQASDERDREVVDVYLDYLALKVDSARVRRDDLVLLAERLILAGKHDKARPFVERWGATGRARERLLAADLINPWRTRSGDEPSQDEIALWLGAFNVIHQPVGLERVTLDAEGPTPYDRLHATSTDRIEDGPLVSVIMSCFHPDAGLVTAVRSMLGQTWANWELLIMDDGSPAEYGELLERVAAMDDRIRVIRAEVNGGTYVRRNDGIAAARGELVTMHDSDDWAHPRRLELQVRHLLENPKLIANVSASLRVSEHLEFVQARGAALRLTESSLLFWRKKAVARVGYYDNVRKAADSEYRLRLIAAFRQDIPLVDVGAPLALVRFTGGSLSGGDLGDGWMHPARVAYRSAMDHWHAQIRAGEADPKIAHPLTARPFPASAQLFGRAPEPQTFDVVMVVDGRPAANPDGLLDRIADELRGLAATGRRVAVTHVDSLVDDRKLGIFPAALQAVVSEGLVTRVDTTDPVETDTVIVRNASVLLGVPAATSGIAARRTVVIEDIPGGRDRRGENFVAVDVVGSARGMFGAEARLLTVEGDIDYTSILMPSPSTAVDRIRSVEVDERDSVGSGR